MDNNIANEEKKTMENGQNEQNQSSAPEKKHMAKAWYWMIAALILIVALIIVLSVMNSNIKKEAKQSLAGAVASVNAHTPALGVTMVLDSVTYDAEANRVTYYNNILKTAEANQQLMREYYRQMSDQDLKVIQILDFKHDYLSDLVLQNESSVKFVYGDTNGAVIRELELTNADLTRKLTEEEIKQASLKMIDQDAKTIQANSPQPVDEYTSITGCTFDSSTATLAFDITLSKDAKDINMADFLKRIEEQKESITHLLSHDSKYIAAGVTVVYKYFDMNGNELIQKKITPKEYMEYQHDHEHDHEHGHGHEHHHEHHHD